MWRRPEILNHVIIVYFDHCLLILYLVGTQQQNIHLNWENYGYGIIKGEEGRGMDWIGCKMSWTEGDVWKWKTRSERRIGLGTTRQVTRGDMLWLEKNQRYVVGFWIRDSHVGAIRLQFWPNHTKQTTTPILCELTVLITDSPIMMDTKHTLKGWKINVSNLQSLSYSLSTKTWIFIHGWMHCISMSVFFAKNDIHSFKFINILSYYYSHIIWRVFGRTKTAKNGKKRDENIFFMNFLIVG